MRFVLLVEGHTERKALPAFLKRWLDPQLSQPVGVKTVRFDGWRDFYSEVAKKTELHLGGPGASEIIAVIGLLDLYAFGEGSGATPYPASVTSPTGRLKWAINDIENRVQQPSKFRMFFALHELEAWLLSQPDCFPQALEDDIRKLSSDPEGVNLNDPPSKRIGTLYRQELRRNYRKIVDGKILFDRLDPKVVCACCPQFARMMDALLLMAKQAGL